MFDPGAFPLHVLIGGGVGAIALIGSRIAPVRNGWATFVLLGLLAALGFASASLAGADGLDRTSLVHVVLLGSAALFAVEQIRTGGDEAGAVESPFAARGPGLLAISVTGGLMAVAGRDLVTVFVGLEACGISAVLLLRNDTGTPENAESALRGLLRSATASGLTLVGFTLIAVSAGAIGLDGMRSAFVEMGANSEVSSVATMGLVLSFAGLGVRAGVAPFHVGQSRLHAAANAVTAGLHTVLPATVALAVMLELALVTRPALAGDGALLCGVLALVTLLLGGAGATFRENPRTVLTLASTAHVGLAMTALVVVFRAGRVTEDMLVASGGPTSGVEAFLLFLVVNAAALTVAHGVLESLQRRDRPADFVDDLAGLGRIEPAAAVGLSVPLLVLAGLPPLPGFWVRFTAISGLLGDPEGPNGFAVLLAVVLIVGSVLVAGVAARWLSTMFFDAPRSHVVPAGGEPALAASMLAAVLIVGVGVLPGPLLGWIRMAASAPESGTLLEDERSAAAATDLSTANETLR